jgi:putative endonuclease
MLRAMLSGLRKWWRWRSSMGGRGERAAAGHLRRSGYRILARNLRTRFGEIDLIAEDRRRGHIVIVEVKTGESDAIAPELHVNFAKQRKLSALAAHLVRRHHLSDRTIRFDVIGVVWPSGSRKPSRLTHHENAFQSTI